MTKRFKKVLLVWFNQDIVKEGLLWLNIVNTKYIHTIKNDTYLKWYSHWMIQLYYNNWIFFDDIFFNIDKWIDTIRKKDFRKIKKEWLFIDSYPLLILSFSNLLKSFNWVKIYVKKWEYKYMYLLELLDIGFTIVNTEYHLIKILNNIDKKFIRIKSNKR